MSDDSRPIIGGVFQSCHKCGAHCKCCNICGTPCCPSCGIGCSCGTFGANVAGTFGGFSTCATAATCPPSTATCCTCACNLCECVIQGETVTVGTQGGTVLVGTVVANDCCKLTLTATAIAVAGLVLTLPVDILSVPITVCCDQITFLVRTGLILGG